VATDPQLSNVPSHELSMFSDKKCDEKWDDKSKPVNRSEGKESLGRSYTPIRCSGCLGCPEKYHLLGSVNPTVERVMLMALGPNKWHRQPMVWNVKQNDGR
jgi:hypothetical protein